MTTPFSVVNVATPDGRPADKGGPEALTEAVNALTMQVAALREVLKGLVTLAKTTLNDRVAVATEDASATCGHWHPSRPLRCALKPGHKDRLGGTAHRAFGGDGTLPPGSGIDQWW